MDGNTLFVGVIILDVLNGLVGHEVSSLVLRTGCVGNSTLISRRNGATMTHGRVKSGIISSVVIVLMLRIVVVGIIVWIIYIN